MFCEQEGLESHLVGDRRQSLCGFKAVAESINYQLLVNDVIRL